MQCYLQCEPLPIAPTPADVDVLCQKIQSDPVTMMHCVISLYEELEQAKDKS